MNCKDSIINPSDIIIETQAKMKNLEVEGEMLQNLIRAHVFELSKLKSEESHIRARIQQMERVKCSE